MKTKINFGKIDARKRGRRDNLVELEVELRSTSDGFPVFSVVGEVLNHICSQWIMGGQCLNEIENVPVNNELFQEIKSLWKKYHLNDTKAGTLAQMEKLRELGIYGYDECCKALKDAGLYEVTLSSEEEKYNPRYAGKPYRYGSGWLYHPIPERDLERIIQIIRRGAYA